VGGTGKTPTVAKLIEMLIRAGRTPHVVTRGYGGRERGPHQVDYDRDTAARVGDEALLLAPFAPTWVARDRAAGAKAAAEAGADVIVLDDGHQNPSLVKDLSIIVVDAEAGFGNERLLPAGPLREPIASGLARAQLVVSIGTAPPPAQTAGLPVFRARLAPQLTGIGLVGSPVIAFAGIGRPQKFFDTVREIGAKVIREVAFPDHHPYSARILNRLAKDAAQARATLVTTEKDAARLPAWFRGRAVILPVRLEVEDEPGLAALLDDLLSGE
jgi:tetraacyldisaccharide 4'-kinase